MAKKKFDHPLAHLEERFQALQDQAGRLPQSCRQELKTAFQDVSQALAALRAAREPKMRPTAEIPVSQEAPGRPKSESLWPLGLTPHPDRCETILNHLFLAIPDLFNVMDRDYNIVMSNWHGPGESVPEAARRGQPKCYRVYWRRDRPCESCHVREVFATGQPQKAEKFNPIDGRIREIRAYPIRDEAGRVVLVAEHVRDITERQEAERALRESEGRFRAHIEDSPESLFLTDVQGTILAASRVAAQRLGKDLTQVTGTSLFDNFPPEVVTRRRPFFDQAVASGRPVRFEDARDDFHFEIHLHPILDADGKVTMLSIMALDITDRKKAEEALRESETKYRTLVENIPQKVFIKNRDYRYVSCNKNFALDLGIRPEEVLGKTDYDFFPKELVDKYRADDQRIMGTGRSENIEERYIQGGQEVWVNTIKTPVRDENGNIVGVLGTFFDITQRKRAEQALKESEERFRAVFETARDAIFIKDRSFRLIQVNPTMARLFGQPVADLIGKTDSDLFGEEDAAANRLEDRRVLNGEMVKEVQTRTIQGVSSTYHVIKVPLYDAAGEIVGLCGIARDIADLKRAEEALRESEERFRSLFEYAPDSFHFMDSQGTFLNVNRAFEKLSGYSREEVIGKNLPLLDEQQKSIAAAELEQVRSGQPPRAMEFNYTTKDGREIIVGCKAVTLGFKRQNLMLVISRDITARKRAESALEESEAHFRLLFEYAPDAYFLMDLQGNFLDANRAAEKLSGYPQEELIGRNFQSQPLLDDRQNILVTELLAKSVYGEVVGPVELALSRKDGQEVIIEAKGLPWEIKGQSLMLAIARDITARKQAEEALRESEQRFRDIAEYAAEWVWEVDAQGKYTYSSPVVEQLLGYQPEEVLGKHIYDFFLSEARAELKNATLAVFAAKQPFRDFLNPNLHKNGQIVWLSANGIPILDEQGNLRGYRGVDIDITERREAEELSRNLIAKSPVGIYLIQNGRFQLVNQWFFTTTGYREDESLHMDPLDLVHPEDREATRENAVKMLKGLSAVPYEYRTITKGGETKWIMETLVSIQYKGNRASLGYFMDVTERKALEEQLLQAQKMEAIGRLAGGVAHDFNNLLMAIMGYSELMRAKVLKDDPLYDHLENILKAGAQASALTQQLLTFSRRQIVHPQLIDLQQVILDLEPMLRRILGEDIELEIIIDPMPVAVKGDPGHLSQIIMNLVVNARDAMPRGGRLTLKTAPVDFPQGCHTRFGLTPPGAYVALEVRDTGLGMDEATQAHIFEPFFTTKGPGQGTGLGLSTVYGIVKQSGGYLDLNSELGKGSAFTILFPRLGAMVSQPKVKIPIAESLRGEETILLVEDEDVLRTLLAKFLRFYGYAVLEARHGGEALLICERHPGPIHLMVTDVVMPQMSGRELADRLIPLRPEMLVLYMSGYTDDAMVHHGVADLAVPFLQKPFKPIDLARQVHDILHPAGQP
jgi:two-component system cell cycle sensor histidine kinase/response regulator CckA